MESSSQKNLLCIKSAFTLIALLAFAFSGVVQKYLIRLVHRGSLWAGGS
jgi:hypothetical protein